MGTDWGIVPWLATGYDDRETVNIMMEIFSKKSKLTAANICFSPNWCQAKESLVTLLGAV